MSRDPAAARPTIVGARGEWLIDAGGREHYDLCMGYGSIWLGHGHPAVVQALSKQLAGYGAPGYLPTPVQDAARAAMAAFLPETHFLGGLYSTGMEAVEAALRAAWAQTGRRHIAGFAGSEHGRSYLAAAIGAAPRAGAPDFVHCLPPFSPAGLKTLERELAALAARVELAAVMVEPVQMTAGGHAAPEETLRSVLRIAREHGAAVIFDETLTGLYRCGARYYAELAGEMPDVIVLGKGMANGYPCAAVVLRKGFAWDRERVRPGSTFWNHPLACAAVAATLGELGQIGAEARVEAIASVIRTSLPGLELTGRGAMWCLAVPDAAGLARFAERLLASGVVVSYYDRYIRLLPAITADREALSRACATIRSTYADTFG